MIIIKILLVLLILTMTVFTIIRNHSKNENISWEAEERIKKILEL